MQKIITTIFIVLLFINISYVFAGVIFHPLQSMDAIGIWLLKAKAFYIEGGFPNNFLHTEKYAYSHQQYPLALPFIYSLIYKFIGGVNEKVILLIYPITYAIILVLAYKIMRKKTTVVYALLFTYIYSMFSPFIAGGGRILSGGADIFLVLLEWIIISILYKKNRSRGDYLVITCLIIVASQIKLEGVFLSIILLFLPISKKLKLLLFCTSLSGFIIWIFIINILKIPGDLTIILPTQYSLLERSFIVVVGIFGELVNVNNWYIFWPISLILIFVKQKISTQLKSELLPSLIVIISLYILTYISSSIDVHAYVNSSFDRVLFQHSPIVFMFFFEKMNSNILDLIKWQKVK